MKNNRIVLMVLGLVILSGYINAAVMLSGATDNCTYLKPGQAKTFLLSIEENVTGDYIVTVTSDGMYVYPQEMDLHLSEGKRALRWIKVRAPIMVVDDYFAVDISVHEANSGNLIESKTYCFHVSKGMLAKKATDIAFGYKNVEVRSGSVVVTLYIANLSQYPVTATLDSDYGKVNFESNPVVVKGYRTAEITAEIPIDEYMPEFITFYAVVDGVERNTTVRMPIPDIMKPDVVIEVPEEIYIGSSLVKFVAKVVNRGDAEVSVKLTGKQLPLGVSVYSDTIKLGPGEVAVLPGFIVTTNVLKPGKYLIKVCLEDEYGAELSCKYTMISLSSEKEVETKEEKTPEGYTVQMTVKNGAEAYYGMRVEVETPSGWKYIARPKTLDMGPYEETTIEITFVPEEDAKEGIALIKLVAPNGTVVAQKTVKLSTSALTGYATVGASSSLGWIIAAIVVALIIALIIKRGKDVETAEIAEFEELTKKE